VVKNFRKGLVTFSRAEEALYIVKDFSPTEMMSFIMVTNSQNWDDTEAITKIGYIKVNELDFSTEDEEIATSNQMRNGIKQIFEFKLVIRREIN